MKEPWLDRIGGHASECIKSDPKGFYWDTYGLGKSAQSLPLGSLSIKAMDS